MIADDKGREASWPPSFREEVKLNFKEFRFVFIDTAYLKYLHNYDSEIFFSADTDYSKKPHLGILINCHGRKYVIPLTSAKRKHSGWRDVTATNYRIYEEIDIRTTVTDRYDVIVDQTILISYGKKVFRKMNLCIIRKEFFLYWKLKRCYR